ncbi:MAG: beta-ketoacyl-[acyl-carrier-protein] synthase family protein [Desulfobacter sp.]
MTYKEDDIEYKRVVVTGMGIISPCGTGLETFWENIIAGKPAITEIQGFDPSGFKSQIAGQVMDFNPRQHGLSESQINRSDRYTQFALAGTRMAMDHSALDMDGIDPERIGVSISNAIAGTKFMEEEFLRLTENGTRPIDMTWASKALSQAFSFNVASSEVAAEYNCNGPCTTLPTGCAGGLDAIGFSLECIRSGDVDVMITGASEAPLTPITVGAFDVVGALSSKRNHIPAQASRPFDRDRDGFVIGEGCGILILEEMEFARNRGATILAEVSGYGSSCNAFHMTDLHPSGKALAAALDVALRDACMDPERVDYISAHGSSTPQNDVSETAALKRVLGDHAYEIPVSSLKSMCGHALAAANSIAGVAAVLSIEHNQVHPTINYEFPDPDCDLNYVPNEAIEAEVNVAVKIGSGFSGIHSAVVFNDPEYHMEAVS